MSVSTSIDLSPVMEGGSSPGNALPQFTPATDLSVSQAPAASAAAANAAAASAASASAAQSAQPPTASEVSAAAGEISSYLSNSKTDIGFALDQSSGQMIVRITDVATGKTIRQIPSEVVLRIAQELKQYKTLDNLKFDEKA
jgi:flagellar protein FlaG